MNLMALCVAAAWADERRAYVEANTPALLGLINFDCEQGSVLCKNMWSIF